VPIERVGSCPARMGLLPHIRFQFSIRTKSLSKSRSQGMIVPLGRDAKRADAYAVNGPPIVLVHCPNSKERLFRGSANGISRNKRASPRPCWNVALGIWTAYFETRGFKPLEESFGTELLGSSNRPGSRGDWSDWLQDHIS
jgi:hypothetical protein